MVAPGGAQPMLLLMKTADRACAAGLLSARNRTELILRLSDKRSCFSELKRLGIAVPTSLAIIRFLESIDQMPFPFVVTQATESGDCQRYLSNE